MTNSALVLSGEQRQMWRDEWQHDLMRWAPGIGTDDQGHVVTHQYMFDFPKILLVVGVLVVVGLLVRRYVSGRRTR